MSPDKLTAQVQNVPAGVARRVQEYERRHQQRQKVISAAEARTTPDAHRRASAGRRVRAGQRGAFALPAPEELTTALEPPSPAPGLRA
ncbi:hypothetical protein ACR6C2_38480 [Streptomyces sp. INA 01156]